MSLVSDILTAVGYRVGETINSSSEPDETTCIQWINETVSWILGVCAQEKSEIGRTTTDITLAANDSSYTELASMYAPAEMRDKDGNWFCGWLLKTAERVPLKLTMEARAIEYDPSNTSEPVEFYFDGANNIIFLPTPDDTYTAKIPNWQIPTTLTATGDTMPYLGLFDNLIIEALAIRIQNRDEYDLGVEFKWFSFIKEEARRLIRMRQGLNSSIGL